MKTGLLARRRLLKGMVENGAMSRDRADKLVAAFDDERGGGQKLTVTTADDGAAEIRLYDAIDSWGSFWGISAAEIAEAIDPISNDMIRLRVNSPGGEVLEGITIHNQFADHTARVEVVVDSLAASIASVIVMAGDEITMNRGSEMMIHNAWGLAIGDAAELRDYADLLDRQTLKAANIYSARAGSPVAAWLQAMATETWYDADEAIEAGLADEKTALKTGPDDEGSMIWDRSIFQYAGRAHAPEPIIPTATDVVEPTTEVAPDSEVAAQAATDERQRAEAVVADAQLAFAQSVIT